MESATVQMRALRRVVTMVGAFKRGDVFWCNKAQAIHFIENQVAEVVGAPKMQPSETKPDAPSVTKVEEPSVKKYLVEEPVGLSTDSAVLNASGKTELPSALPQATLSTTSQKRTNPFSGLVKGKRK